MPAGHHGCPDLFSIGRSEEVEYPVPHRDIGRRQSPERAAPDVLSLLKVGEAYQAVLYDPDRSCYFLGGLDFARCYPSEFERERPYLVLLLQQLEAGGRINAPG
jgi:hypothetical protein